MLKCLASGRTPQDLVAEFPELEPADVADCLRCAAWLASGRGIESPSWRDDVHSRAIRPQLTG
ncbi:MAG: DUF433 domain-containing protein [Planctomycetes bacterium]|nr:DUF433 domain-containing protein [Planctomycetota bacterium]